MLFGAGNVKEFQDIKDILDLYCLATGMELNKGKSSIQYNDLGKGTREQLVQNFPFVVADIEEGIKYLDFLLNQNSYGYAN